MTTTINNNGTAPRTRRQLNDSIERMDQLIDGLATAIPGTIKDVLEENISKAISAGIKAAVLEVLTDPELATILRGILPAASLSSNQDPAIVPNPRPSLLRRMVGFARDTVAGAVRWVRDLFVTAVDRVAGTTCFVVAKLMPMRRHLWLLRLTAKFLVLAITIGGLTALVALFAPDWAVTTLNGLGGACLSLVAQAGIRFRGIWPLRFCR